MTRRAVGGMRNHLIGLLKHLNKDVFEPVVFLPNDDSFEQELKVLDVKYYNLDISDRINPLKDILAIIRLRRLLKELHPSLVHIHGNKTALIGRISARKIAPVIVTVHNFLDESQKRFWFIVRAFERFFCKWSDKIICVSDALRKNLIRVYRIPASKIELIQNGIDIELWNNVSDKADSLERLKLPEGLRYLGMVGRMVEFKGHEYAIQAMPEIIDFDPYARLVIVGNGPNKKKLTELVDSLGIKDKVFFLGHISWDMREVYPAFDIFLFPSINEPFGIAVLEAMVCRLPIIATDSGGVSEILEDERTALLVKPQNSADIAKKYRQLETDPALKKKIARNAQEKVFDEYSIDTMVDKIMEVYLKCLHGRAISHTSEPSQEGV